MSFHCPKCKTPLSVHIEADTDYSKTETLLASVSHEDKYRKLPGWKRSPKRTNLLTQVVTDELLADPDAKELLDRLREWGQLKVDKVTYKLSEFNGRTYLQCWEPIPIGGA
jgi:hypothetical protein